MSRKFSLLVVVLLLSSLAFAHEEFRTPDEMVNIILSRQGVADAKQLDCSKISHKDFELLGDAIMDRMVGDHELHEQMDDMMGGEGSASLRSMHIVMGKNWLGCSTVLMSGMMNTNMMPMMMRMMGNYYPAYYNSSDALLFFAVVGWVLFGVSFIYFYARGHKRRK